MAITTTLSRLKNYFIGWHTANYRTLHEFTNRITDEEPDGSKLVESKTIFQYVTGQIDDAKTKLTDDFYILINELKDIIGNKCKISYYNDNDVWTSDDIGGTLWSNICTIWNTIGRFSDYNVGVNSAEPRRESIWGWIAWLRYGDNGLGYWTDWDEGLKDWGGNVIASLGRKKHSALGWAHLLYQRTRKANVTYTNLNPSHIQSGIISSEYMDKYLTVEYCSLYKSKNYDYKFIAYRRGAWATIFFYGSFKNLATDYTYNMSIDVIFGNKKDRFVPVTRNGFNHYGSCTPNLKFAFVDAADTADAYGNETLAEVFLNYRPAVASGTFAATIVYPIRLNPWTPSTSYDDL